MGPGTRCRRPSAWVRSCLLISIVWRAAHTSNCAPLRSPELPVERLLDGGTRRLFTDGAPHRLRLLSAGGVPAGGNDLSVTSASRRSLIADVEALSDHVHATW